MNLDQSPFASFLIEMNNRVYLFANIIVCNLTILLTRSLSRNIISQILYEYK